MVRPGTVDLRPLKEFVRKELEEGHPFRKAVEVLPDAESWEDFAGQLRILFPLARRQCYPLRESACGSACHWARDSTICAISPWGPVSWESASCNSCLRSFDKGSPRCSSSR